MSDPTNSRLVASVVLLTVLFVAAPVASAATSGAEVLKLSGCDHGLCAVIGCGSEESPALAAELTAPGKLVVHGIAPDDASLARAREAIAQRGVAGLAAVERLALKPLPYRDNVLNLMVVEDLDAAAAAGFSREEAMRALAPGGKLCTRSGGKWELTAKPWPESMDEWTHEAHDPGGNCVSRDKVVKFPLGYRWNAGLPMNLQHPAQTANAWSATRGMAVAGGRCFTLSNSVFENVGPTYQSEHGVDQYVTARDAFNGLFLWRRKLGATYYGGLFYPNRAPFVGLADVVYAANEKGELVALDAATGDVQRTFATTYNPGVILVDGGVVVTATWRDGARVGGLSGVDRRRMTFGVAEGTVEAFDAGTGAKLWGLDKLATSLRSAGGLVYLLERKGPDPLEEKGRGKGGEGSLSRPEQAVVAVDLRSGKVRWTAGPDVLGRDDPLRLDAAGLGVVTVSHNNGAKTTALAAEDGKVLLQTAANSYTSFYDGAVQIGPNKYDPQTGQPAGPAAFSLGRTICTPHYWVNGILVANRGCGFRVDGKPTSYRGARGGCLFASIPANGEFYTPQNWCRCAPSQIQGFVAFGPVGHEPTAEEMEAPPAVEKGPAAGTLSGTEEPTDWPTYRHDPQRSNGASCKAPGALDVLWQARLCPPAPDSAVGVTWRERLTDPLTAPVVAEGVMVTAAADRHQVIAVDAGSGEERWRQTLGARVDTPPTIHEGACVFGSNDGWVYALSVRDGRLAWRMRAAPLEERLVSYGQVESPWPAIGTVLVCDGVAYASAGRSQGSDGGVLVRAFKPQSGEPLWSKALAGEGNARALRINDLMLCVGRSVQLMTTRMDPKAGELLPNPTAEQAGKRRGQDKTPPLEEIAPSIGLEGFVSGNWTRLGNRKYGAMGFGNVRGELVSWSDAAVCACRAGKNVQAFRRDRVGPAGVELDPEAPMWSHTLPGEFQATSLIVCPDAVLLGGGIYRAGSELAQGFVRVLSLDDGRVVAEQTLAAPLGYNALALAGGRVYATLADGSAVCLGTKPAQ